MYFKYLFFKVRGFLDNVVTSEIPKFEEKFLAHLKEIHPQII